MTVLNAVLSFVLSSGGVLGPESSAEQRIESAQRALDVGDDAKAAAEFEAAYEALSQEQRASELGALLHDEAVAAHRRRYEATGDQEHLVAEQKLLRAYLDELDAWGEAGPRRKETFTRLTDVDRRLMGHGSRPTGLLSPRSEGPTGTTTATDARPPTDPRPNARGDGRALRIAGIVTMAVGGAQALIGLGVGAQGFAKSSEFSDQLRRESLRLANEGCDSSQPSDTCVVLQDRVAFTRQNGQSADRRGVLGMTAAAVGVLALGLGIGLFVVGGRRELKAKEAAWRFGPEGIAVRF